MIDDADPYKELRAQVARDAAEVRRELAVLEASVSRLRKRLAALDDVSEAIGSLLGEPASLTERPSSEPMRRKFKTTVIGDVAETILRENGKPMRSAAIGEVMVNRRLSFPGGQPKQATIYASMKRLEGKVFTHKRGGDWGLIEWDEQSRVAQDGVT